jgi:hypothetical protein
LSRTSPTAHRRLDEAVFAAYGCPADLADDDLPARLLALERERAAQTAQAQSGFGRRKSSPYRSISPAARFRTRSVPGPAISANTR